MGQFVSKGGIGYGVDETLKVEDDGKGYIWLAAEMSPGGLALETFRSTPYGKRALFCAKADNVQELFDKVNWDIMNKRIDTTLGGPQISSGEARTKSVRLLAAAAAAAAAFI